MLTNTPGTMIELSRSDQDLTGGKYQCKVRIIKHLRYEKNGKGSAIPGKPAERRTELVMMIFSSRSTIVNLKLAAWFEISQH